MCLCLCTTICIQQTVDNMPITHHHSDLTPQDFYEYNAPPPPLPYPAVSLFAIQRRETHAKILFLSPFALLLPFFFFFFFFFSSFLPSLEITRLFPLVSMIMIITIIIIITHAAKTFPAPVPEIERTPTLFCLRCGVFLTV